MIKKIHSFNVVFLIVLAFVWLLTMPLWSTVNSTVDKQAGDSEKIEEYVLELMEKADIPGLSLVVINGDKPEFIKGFGYADKEKKIPVTPDTLFELASCSKAFTALAALRLEQEGLIKLDLPVSHYLPWFYAQYQNQKKPITLRQCLHHTSGIPWKSLSKIPPGDSSSALELTVKNIAGIQLDHIPGRHYEYATVNYDIVGAVIEKITGKSFEEYIENDILQPLGLHHTAVGVDNKRASMAKGYKIGYFSPRQYDSPAFRGNNPAAYVISNAKDMARWLRVQMGMVDTGLAPLVQRSHVPDLTVPPPGNLASYAMGWRINQFQKGTVYHTGFNPNFTAYIGFRPQQKIGVVLLANSNSAYTGFIGGNVLKLLAGEEINRNPPPLGGADSVCSILSFIVGAYILAVIFLIFLRIINGIRGKVKFVWLNWNKIRRLIVVLFMGIPLYVGIYLIPHALADMSWQTAMVWGPISLYTFTLLLAVSLVLSYIHFFVSLILVTKNRYRNEIPLIAVISILSGLAGTGMLFLITTSFFSTTKLFYLVYYFGVTYLVHVMGRKIVQVKLTKLSNNIALDLRISLIHKIFSTRYQRFEKLQDGRIFTTLNDDTSALSSSAGHVINFVTSVVTAISTFIYMTTISVLATLVVFGVLGLMAVYYIFVSKRSRVFMEAARDTQNVYMGLLNGLIKGYKELVIHWNKKYEYKTDLIDSAKEYCSTNIAAAIKFINARIVSDSMILIILGVLSIVVPRLLISSNIISLVAFVMAILYLFGPIGMIISTIRPVTRIQVSWNRIKNFVKDLDVEGDKEQTVRDFVKNLDLPKPLESQKIEPFNPKTKVEKLKVEGLMFEYRSNGKEENNFSLGPIDFEVNKGEALFIVGGNGSGKTTVAKLITGLYFREGGSFKINGEDVDDSKIGEYFSTIFSNFHLFKKLYNVDLNNKESLVQEYLKILNLHEKLELKDGKYSTLDLSGGQRKRLALLQCYLENRPIFLFDELAADQDPHFRKFFYRELLADMKKQEKIVIAITHDDHYFNAADKIIKLDMGKVDFFERREEFEKKGGAIWTYNKS